ncbi:ribosomal protein L15 [[Synechococcus] sp. NIES-970]|uniref:50S ribosomal protein L15 n=1 Tax=Picosynechococcus sp. NKBG15041c TaxID=1407650 RepID=UPI00040E1195|nr:50S ribosomal protein L15 [Picosynechococcus sp. NKBG15041c]BAW96014.1 ribosomal protein L15 [[Synechococcus] sp. NIES-970]
MKLSDLSPKAGSKKRRRRVGRGIAAGQGASCGFGMRGQKSRSGTGTKAGFEGGQMPLYRRVPKLKHFTIVNPKNFTVVNISQLAALPANSEVTLDSLIAAGIVTTNDGPLKILGDGELSVALKVKAAGFSASAKAKIEAAGGSCDV